MNWHDLYGMETPRSQLGMAISSGRLGHAHILAGPEGSGRRTFALMVARHRLCENREADLHDATLASCGTCPSCKQVEAGNHPDCQTWTKPEEDKEFKIKIMRDLIENLSLKSTCGRGRIAIIEPAEDFSTETSNCFLKTLEEPAPGMWIALICQNPESLLPTIRSRCQMLRFQPLSNGEVEQILENKGLSDSIARREVARLSDGLPGLALNLMEPSERSFWESCRKILLAKPFVGSAWADLVKGKIENLTGGPIQRAAIRAVLRLHMGLWSDLLRVVHGLDPRRQPESAEKSLAEVANRLDAIRLTALAEATTATNDRIRYGATLALAIESMGDSLEDILSPPRIG
jgi:DNA polymerase-3 subunit delta'